jgi:hypothetical protein
VGAKKKKEKKKKKNEKWSLSRDVGVLKVCLVVGCQHGIGLRYKSFKKIFSREGLKRTPTCGFSWLPRPDGTLSFAYFLVNVKCFEVLGHAMFQVV